MKTIESKVAPNPKEAQIWVDLSADRHGNITKIWNGHKWVEKTNSSKGITEKEINDIVKNYLQSIENKYTALKKEVSELIEQITLLHNYDDTNLRTAVNNIAKRVSKLEQHIITD